MLSPSALLASAFAAIDEYRATMNGAGFRLPDAEARAWRLLNQAPTTPALVRSALLAAEGVLTAWEAEHPEFCGPAPYAALLADLRAHLCAEPVAA